MKSRIKTSNFFFFPLWLAGTSLTLAQGSPAESLRGIDKIKLSATVTESPEVKGESKIRVRAQMGLSRTLESEVAQRLRKETGIQIVDDMIDRGGMSTGIPYLYFTVGFLTSEKGLHTQRVELTVRQMTNLVRDPSIPNASWTWKSQYIRNLGDQKPEDLLEASRELVDLVLEDFFRDFHSMNPQ